MDSLLPDTALPTLGPPGIMENVTYDELHLGRSASLEHTVTRRDIVLFAAVSGDVNPAHLDQEYADASMFHGVIAHGMLSAGFISAVLGTTLPGPGTIYLSQDLRFCRPVKPGDRITVTVTVVAKDDEKKRVTLDCRCVNQGGKDVVTGTALVIAPVDKILRQRPPLPELQLLNHDGHEALLQRCRDLPPIRTAVAYPCDEVSLRGAVEAGRRGLIVPILVGPRATIQAVADRCGLDLADLAIVEAGNDRSAAAAAVALARDGKADAVMKGSLHSDTLLAEVVRRDTGLRTGRKISHVFVMHPQGRETPLLVTDAVVMMFPTLEDKVDITQNAIDLAHALGLERPRVAVLSAVETVSPKIPSTLDAAALTVMAARGQISGAVVDGPLAFDNAVDPDAARIKGIASEVAGCADILVAPNFEAGNMIAKELSKLARADGAGIVLGARCPIILTSRSDNERSRVASCAVALMLAHAERRG
ncbi:bifunctional enoyl-CoA hydratase/phosphate acetyltransferase [Azospirillum sp. ST 5-10]|uniref:bifunctional enoyl-CoA hydratase/phosphate acetyltransferase n=1 Tax=unclassified Azospirillum TaxID=2630922 RepID=UPI003F49F54F